MVEVFLVLLLFVGVLYAVFNHISNRIKKADEKIEVVKMQLKEISMKLDVINKKL